MPRDSIGQLEPDLAIHVRFAHRPGEVHMGIDKTRNEIFAAGIDDLCSRRDADLVVPTHGLDAAAPDQHRRVRERRSPGRGNDRDILNGQNGIQCGGQRIV